jgi:dihydroorotate dehydrogenase
MSVLDRLARAALYRLDPETAHHAALWALEHGLAGLSRTAPDSVLATKVWGLSFPNPIGLAAGFDKDARVADAMLRLGFGFVEAGTVTPRPQAGNPRPRLFRLTEDDAIINRLGFNSGGIDAFVERLRARPRDGIVGANVGKNRDTDDAAGDYAIGIAKAAPFADYLVVNISSPNTPGLRDLQAKKPIADLIARAQSARARSVAGSAIPPLLAKIAPDLSEAEMRDIADVALETKLDGLIVSNTTVARPADLRSASREETGGLSGKPLFAASTACLAAMYRLTEGRIPLIGCGGVSSGRDAYAKIRAGASLVQVYSALIFRGVSVVMEINLELARLLRADGFTSVAEAAGADHA